MRAIAAILVVVASAGWVGDDPLSKDEVKKLECDLIVKQKSGTEGSSFLGSLTLKNKSKNDYKITYTDDLTEHLSLEVRDDQGRLLPNISKSYGDMYAKIHDLDDMKTQDLVINPGETYLHRLVLVGQVDRRRKKLTPGNYTVQAIFKNNGEEFRSKKHHITVLME